MAQLLILRKEKLDEEYLGLLKAAGPFHLLPVWPNLELNAGAIRENRIVISIRIKADCMDAIGEALTIVFNASSKGQPSSTRNGYRREHRNVKVLLSELR